MELRERERRNRKRERERRSRERDRGWRETEGGERRWSERLVREGEERRGRRKRKIFLQINLYKLTKTGIYIRKINELSMI